MLWPHTVVHLIQSPKARVQDAEGKSSLMLAAARGDTETVAVLLETGAPWNATDRAGMCAGDHAALHGHEETFETIVEAGVQNKPHAAPHELQ